MVLGDIRTATGKFVRVDSPVYPATVILDVYFGLNALTLSAEKDVREMKDISNVNAILILSSFFEESILSDL